MEHGLNELINRIRELEEEVEAELDRRREALHFRIEDRKVRFEAAVLQRHRQLRTGLLRYIAQIRPRTLLTAPIIYSLIVPLLFLDLAVSLYQAICFPLYGIPRLRRRDYLVLDRNQLAYLNAIEKFNCAYCAYANGLAAYLQEIAARTEQYWCPIKHARRILGAHSRYSRFLDYGDAEAYRQALERVRRDFTA